MFKVSRVLIILFIVIILFCSTKSLALVGCHSKGTWPESWPVQLEPYREQATTLEIAAGNQENVYDIHFDKREQFEKIWPTILELKSKGAPLRLRSIEKPFKEGTLFHNEKPAVRIYAPAYPVCESHRLEGKILRSGPPWPDSIRLPDGELPEYVTISEDGMTWVPIYGKSPDYVTVSVDWTSWDPIKIKKPRGFIYRARIEIELIVDGNIIDLNRIRLPSETSIIDRRTFEKQD